jgi:hypothetical protein
MRLAAAATVAAVAALAACGPKVKLDPMPFEHDDPSAGTPSAHADEPPGAAPATTTPPRAPTRRAPPGSGTRTGTIPRATLLATLDAGPGAFLHGFEVAPVMNGDRFAGWRLVQLMDGEHRFDGLDLAPGDILLAINGQPISKPDQLAAVWDSLRAANELVLDLARDQAAFQLRFAINPPANAANAATPAAARP